MVTSGLVRPLHVILVDKSLQRLYLYLYQPAGQVERVRRFPCSTGKSEGDKVKEGDLRTPEGVYFFTKLFRDNKVTIFGNTAYHINYPDPFDGAEGRDGNGIYLHGTNRPLGSRATNGCVVMNNSDLDFLSRRIRLHDTPIIISRRLSWLARDQFDQHRATFRKSLASNRSQWGRLTTNPLPAGARLNLDQAVLLREAKRAVVLIPVSSGGDFLGWQSIYLAEYPDTAQVLARVWQPLISPAPVLAARAGKARRQEVLVFLQDWVRAWESRNVDSYMAFYSKRFKAYGMNYRQWRTYKSRLANKYRAIDVEIGKIDIKLRGRRALVSFRQKYFSDQFQDVGRKLLKLRQEKGAWKIWREDWKPEPTIKAKK
ncbi:MAG: L,D-transpeptidase [Deltaproteobacteria bacterium]|nr:L,D-transpeptidase [Deltaproteobacteria bacterium]